ncbi:hypothetical protein EJ110_NYTH35846 [Nymphaea thermarum]|nr:hypothetical protein EJ110_NYTH35846 [Nymphaea thermarum]
MQQRAGVKHAGWAASCCRALRWSSDRRTTWARPGCCGSDEGGECRVAATPTCLPSPGVARPRASADLFTTVTVDEPAPGLKAIFSFVFPDQKSGKVELQYFHDHGGISTSIGLTANPIVKFSGVLGSSAVALGTDVAFDTATGNFTMYNGGLSYSNADLIASLNLNDKGDTLVASYIQSVSPLTSTTIGAELSHSFSNNESTLTIGTQHALDPLTLVKARLNNYGKASVLIQHQCRPRSFFTISGEVDTTAIEKSAKVGFSLALKP